MTRSSPGAAPPSRRPTTWSAGCWRPTTPTPATALTFTLHLLGRHPDAQRRVREEARAVLGRRPPTVAGTVGGYRLPAGSVVVISPWVTHRHPRHWPHPDRFEPDRFTPEAEAGRHRYAYLPFGGGPRACIGSHFAMLEAVVATAIVAASYGLKTPPGPVPLAAGITLRPAAAVPCTLQRPA